MVRKKKGRRGRLPLACNKWRQGVCEEIVERRQIVVYCPRARAENARPGQCCHHSLFTVRPRLEELRRAGVKLKRYGKKLRDPDFVARLYAAYQKAKKRRSKRSRQSP